jgi:uncharacterized protein (DUF4415 family)/uncharacterized DUF497 family protein
VGSGKECCDVRRHGVAFRDAARIFDGPTVERTDDRYHYGEVRIHAIGLVNGVEITVIYTIVTATSATSYRPGGRNLMSDDISGTISKTKPKTDWRRLRSITDDEIRAAIIDDPDAQPTDEAFWKEAHVVMPRRKETITRRLDADLLDWFRGERGYQTRINAILRAYMNTHADGCSSVT